MRRAGIVLATLVLLALHVAPAHAATTTTDLLVDSSAWSWRTVTGLEPSNVPAGDLAVQYDGQADPAKATFLHLDLSSLPAGATTTGLTLVLPLDPAVDQDASSAPVVACPLKGALVPGNGVDPAKEPAADCAHPIKGGYDAKAGAVGFALGALAQQWLTGPNNGIVVRPDPAAAVPGVLPFQLDFQGAGAVIARATVTVPDAAPEPTQGSTSPQPVPQPPALPVVVPPLPLPTAEPVPAPSVVAQPQPSAQVVALPVARTTVVRAAGRASATGFALATALGALLLALVGWSVGEGGNTRAFARAERRALDRFRPELARVRQPRQIRQGRRPAVSAASTVTSS